MRRAALVQFSASRADSKFEKLQLISVQLTVCGPPMEEVVVGQRTITVSAADEQISTALCLALCVVVARSTHVPSS